MHQCYVAREPYPRLSTPSTPLSSLACHKGINADRGAARSAVVISPSPVVTALASGCVRWSARVSGCSLSRSVSRISHPQSGRRRQT
jgi:hypothetical protein